MSQTLPTRIGPKLIESVHLILHVNKPNSLTDPDLKVILSVPDPSFKNVIL